MTEIVANCSNTEWKNINVEYGVSVGSKFTIINLSSYPIKVISSLTEPSDVSDKAVTIPPYKFVMVNPDNPDIWVTGTEYHTNPFIVSPDPAFRFTDETIDPRVYLGTQGLTVQSFVEANTKNGTQFSLSVEVEIPPSEKRYYALNTPSNVNKNVIIKNRLITTNGGIRYRPYIGGSFTQDNNPLPIINLNAQSSNVSESVINPVQEGNISSLGTSFDVIRTTSGAGNNRVSGIFGGGIGIERVLPKDSEILVEFENLESQTLFVVYSITWYEGQLSNEIN